MFHKPISGLYDEQWNIGYLAESWDPSNPRHGFQSSSRIVCMANCRSDSQRELD